MEECDTHTAEYLSAIVYVVILSIHDPHANYVIISNQILTRKETSWKPAKWRYTRLDWCSRSPWAPCRQWGGSFACMSMAGFKLPPFGRKQGSRGSSACALERKFRTSRFLYPEAKRCPNSRPGRYENCLRTSASRPRSCRKCSTSPRRSWRRCAHPSLHYNEAPSPARIRPGQFVYTLQKQPQESTTPPHWANLLRIALRLCVRVRTYSCQENRD